MSSKIENGLKYVSINLDTFGGTQFWLATDTEQNNQVLELKKDYEAQIEGLLSVSKSITENSIVYANKVVDLKEKLFQKTEAIKEKDEHKLSLSRELWDLKAKFECLEIEMDSKLDLEDENLRLAERVEELEEKLENASELFRSIRGTADEGEDETYV